MTETLHWAQAAFFAIYIPSVAHHAWHLMSISDALFVTIAMVVMLLDALISALRSTSKRLRSAQ